MRHIKVFFKGESMWVKVDHMAEDGMNATGMLDNKPINAVAHNYRYGDDVVCHKIVKPDYSCWEPVHPINPNRSDGEDSRFAGDVIDDDISPVGNLQ